MIEAQVRREMLRIARLCYERNLLVAMDGNLSVRLDEDRILATKAGCHKGMLRDPTALRQVLLWGRVEKREALFPSLQDR